MKLNVRSFLSYYQNSNIFIVFGIVNGVIFNLVNDRNSKTQTKCSQLYLDYDITLSIFKDGKNKFYLSDWEKTITNLKKGVELQYREGSSYKKVI